MKTPIYDFVQNYINQSPARLHMPGHKGSGPLGLETYDITEISGADVLYHEDGILKESQENASTLFGSEKTLYSTEGATLCIRAMLALVKFYADEIGKKPIIAASRNAHKAFITGCAHVNLNPVWINHSSDRLLSSNLSGPEFEDFLRHQEEKPIALYITSPDYLGNLMDIDSISRACRKNDILLLVDNAHGSYLHFLPESFHPLDLGADIVCDSAHKTLPVLTGGAYLHISKEAPSCLRKYAAKAMAMFASSSPSYLILQSLDLCNHYLNEDYRKKLYEFSSAIVDSKKKLRLAGFSIVGDEPLKITLMTKSYGYLGCDFAKLLEEKKIFVEFSDPDYVVFMFTPEQGIDFLNDICKTILEISPKEPILQFPPKIPTSEKLLSPTKALYSPFETLPLDECVGRILAQPGVTCPPAIPIAICGEKITEEHIKAFRYYGIEMLDVKK